MSTRYAPYVVQNYRKLSKQIFFLNIIVYHPFPFGKIPAQQPSGLACWQSSMERLGLELALD